MAQSPPNTDQQFISDPCIIFALGREARPFLRAFPPHQRFPTAPCQARFCGPARPRVLVLQAGIGAASAKRALDWVLHEPRFGNLPYRPRLVLSAGFSGAIQENLRVGDIILATEVVDSNANRWNTSWPGELPKAEWSQPFRCGRLFASSRIVGEPKEKLALGRKHEALAVDMETATVARLCHQHGVPFGCVRAISDDAATPLSRELIAVFSHGDVSAWRLIVAAARHRKLFGELYHLAQNTRFAAQQLGRALAELLTLTFPKSREL